MGLRAALGASRLRIVRQFLVESLMLSGTAAALGAVFAYWTLPGLLVLAQNNLPFANDIRISLPVLGATVLLAVAAGAVIGLYPAVLGSRSDVRASAKAEGKGMPFAFSPCRRLGFLATC